MLVIVAVGVPTFIVIAALALDFGNWYAHRRQVQNQVDAAAFAAGVAYGYNFPACITAPAASNNITAKAMEYGSPPDNGSTPATVNPDPCQPQSAGDYASPPGTMWTEVTVRDKVATLFGGFGFSPTISAKARVAVMQLKTATGIRPFAIANPGLTDCARVDFRDENNSLVRRATLSRGANNHWTGSADFQMPSQDVHADVTLGGDCSSGSQSITYTNVGFIQSWKSSDPFQAVQLYPSGGCDASFVPRNGGDCQFDIFAIVHGPPGAQITSVTGHISGTTVTLGQAGGPGSDIWQATAPGGSGPATVSPGEGALAGGNGVLPVTLEATYDLPAGGSGNIDPVKVQAVMAGDDTQVGPIADLVFSPTSVNNQNPVSTTVDLVLEPLVNGGPTVTLRGLSADVHTLNGAVRCPPANDDLGPNVANGCEQPYQVAVSGSCSGANPPDCAVGTATTTSLLGEYNNLWAHSGVCSPNNWPGSLNQIPSIPRGDPRLITVAVTKVGGSFGSGDSHPIVAFVAFYVTGWQGASACGASLPQATATVANGNEFWGHFLKFVEPSSTGGPFDQPCTAPVASTDIAACIATLVQ